MVRLRLRQFRFLRRPLSKVLLLVCLCMALTIFLLNKQPNSTTGNLLKDPPEPLDAALVHPNHPILEETSAIKNLPMPPAYILGQQENGPQMKNKSCAIFPTLYHIQFNNLYWQTLRTSEGTIQFFGAYYDDRSESPVGPSLRFTAMLDWKRKNRTNRTVTTTTYSQLWFDDEKEPQFSKVLEYKLIWNETWRIPKRVIKWYPYLITYQIPSSHKNKVPKSVSVVESRCDTATNNLRVHFDKPHKKKDFAVCVKGLDYAHADVSFRLVEWIELIRILGADKIFIYELAVHPNISKVLKYYKDTGFVDVSPLTLPGDQPNSPIIRHVFLKNRVHEQSMNEVIPYNDCLYRNMYSYEYIALLDIDEVIIPKNVDTWKELIDIVVRNMTSEHSKNGYAFRNVLFQDDMNKGQDSFPGIPKHLHMLQHIFRAQNYSKPRANAKCFHKPEKIYTIHNHFPFELLDRSSHYYPSVDTEIAHLQHYRRGCILGSSKTNCDKKFLNNSVKDTTIWKYKDALIESSNKILKTLGLIHPTHASG